MADLAALLADLRAEGHALDALVAGLPEAGWRTPTPAAGWTVAHQIAHLAWTDEVAALAAIDPGAFAAGTQEAAAQPGSFVDRAADAGAALPPPELLARWRTGRQQLLDLLAALPAGARIAWYGPPMSAASMATARLMETWAHGLDVADALGARREPTARLRHVAHLGIRTRDYAFAANGHPPPTEEFRVELTGPGGEPWTWGPPGAAQRVAGPALDFALLVTRRRHRADLALAATGPDAERWLDLAQAFAGPPGGSRAPGKPG